MRITVISDMHLSRKRPFFQVNWEIVLKHLSDAPPDLVVCAGDMALNGPSDEDDLAFARAQLDRLPVPWLAVPGNHDLGNCLPDLRGEHTVTSAYISTYRKHFGSDYWLHDKAGWRLIGLNALVMGSDLEEESDQWAFLSDALAEAGDQEVGIFLHKPAFLSDPDDERMHPGSLFPAPRSRFLEAIEGTNVRFIVSGHNHELTAVRHGSIMMQWCPATSFLILRHFPEPRGGERVLGWLEFDIDGSDFRISPVTPDEMAPLDIGGWLVDGIGVYQAMTTGSHPTPMP